MNPLLTTLGSRLAERWLNFLVLPGALFLVTATAGAVLGQSGWRDLDRLRAAADAAAAHPAAGSTGTAALLVVGVLLLSAAASLAVQFLAGGIERFWMREAADPLSRALVRRRTARWKRRDEAIDEAHERHARQAREGNDPDYAEIVALTAARDRICLVEPSRPTWYGDRMEAAAERVRFAYRLDLLAAWPRLWLVLDEAGRAQAEAAHGALTGAARLAAWAGGYAVLALWWWPSAVVAAGCALTARSRARDAVTALATLLEAAVDVHGRELAARIGLAGAEPAGRLEPRIGDRMSELFRKAN